MPLCYNKRIGAFAQDWFTTTIVVEVNGVANSCEQTGIGYDLNTEFMYHTGPLSAQIQL